MGFFVYLCIYNDMGKTIVLTESELINIIKKIVLSRPVISEVDKIKDFDEDFPEYNYSSIGVIPDKLNPNQIGVVFFNGLIFNKSDYRNPEYHRTIHFNGPLGDFSFDSRKIHYNGKSPYVFGNDLKHSYYDELLLLMNLNKSEPSSGDFTSQEIRDALKMAFPEKWVPETDEYTAGLRNIAEIGKFLEEKEDFIGDTSETWSVMNFFDTKKEVKNLINKKWNDEGSGDKIEWLSSIFQDDTIFLSKLLDIQWNSVYDGFFKNEQATIKNLINAFKKLGQDIKFKTYPFGHKKDRHSGIDIEIEIPGEKPMTIQIKPVKKTEKQPNGDIKVYTYGMNNNYKTKKDLGYILYNKGDRFIMFKNENYHVIPSSNGTEVIHKDKPFKIH